MEQCEATLTLVGGRPDGYSFYYPGQCQLRKHGRELSHVLNDTDVNGTEIEIHWRD